MTSVDQAMTRSNEQDRQELPDVKAQAALVALARLLGRLIAREYLEAQADKSRRQSARRPSANAKRRSKSS